jgi:Lrp/AsnC family leucine-responsive transcriptional regulator
MQLLDLKDRKILYQLDLNARQSNTQIARKVGLSKEVTNYRIKRLEKEGYLAGYHTLINFSKLGMTSMRVYLKLIDANPEKEEELINTLVRHNKVLFVLQTEGLYDIGFALLVKNIKEFEECYTVIKEQFKPYIEAERISFHTEIHHYHRAYFLEKKHDDVPAVVIREEGLSEYDETDFKILCLLSGNARMPLLEIAEKTGIAPRTAANRIHQLEKKKIVIGYRSICNIKKINYEYYKTDFVLRDIQHLKKLIDFAISIQT